MIVHGLGEHSGRYERLATRLHAQGWSIVAYDQRGHGLSGGPRGGLRHADDLPRDLTAVLDHVRARYAGQLVLLGHSMGGAVAADFVLQRRRPVDALILSSPALEAGLSRLDRWLLSSLHRLAPDLAVGNRLQVSYISHDASVVEAYRSDPLVHDRITARLARYLVDAGRRVVAAADRWSVPTLLIWAGADRLVNASGSAAFASAAPAKVVQSHCYHDLYHEIFNERDAEPVFQRVERWLQTVNA